MACLGGTQGRLLGGELLQVSLPCLLQELHQASEIGLTTIAAILQVFLAYTFCLSHVSHELTVPMSSRQLFTGLQHACRAVSDLGDEVFVKFPCFPGAEADFNGRGTCKNGMPAGTEDIPRRHQAAIQAVTDFCGLSVIKSRSWTAPVHAVTPEVWHKPALTQACRTFWLSRC